MISLEYICKPMLAAALACLPVLGVAQTFDRFDVPGADRLLLRGTQAEALERAVQEQKDPVFAYVRSNVEGSTGVMSMQQQLRFGRLTDNGDAVYTGRIVMPRIVSRGIQNISFDRLRISSDSNYYAANVFFLVFPDPVFRTEPEFATTSFIVGTTRNTGSSDRVGPARISVEPGLRDDLGPRIHGGALLNMTNMLDDFEASCPDFTARARAEALLRADLSSAGMGDLELEFLSGGPRTGETPGGEILRTAIVEDVGFTEDNTLVLRYFDYFEATYRLFGSARFEIDVREDFEFTVGLKMGEGRIWRVNECEASNLPVMDGQLTDDVIAAVVDGGLSINGRPLMRAREDGGGLFETNEVELIAGPVAGR